MIPLNLSKVVGPAEAMSMNRHDRRRFGKANNVKIPGIKKQWKTTKLKKK